MLFKEYKVKLNRNKSIEILEEALNKIEIRGEQLYLLKQAIKYVLAEREQDKKRIKEQERKIYDYDEIIARLEEENTKKDKMIDLIAEKLAKTYHYTPKKCSLKDKENIDCNNYKNCTDCAKQYFERKVKE